MPGSDYPAPGAARCFPALRAPRRRGFAVERAALLLAVLSAGCAARPVRYVTVVPASAQAISLLGDTLWTLPIAPEEGQRRVRLLFQARDEAAARPHDANVQILLARRTADLGRFREAIGLYSEALAEHPTDLRIPRRRGELLLRIREFIRAEGDLRHAARESLERPMAAEFNEIEDGDLLVGTTLQFRSLFYLGMTHYLRGAFGPGREMFREARRRAVGADDLAAASLWQFFSARRLGELDQAVALLNEVPSEDPMTAVLPEHRMLLAFRGDLRREDLLRNPLRPVGPDQVLYAYGLGFALLLLDRTGEAAMIFHAIRETPDWSALAYLAAEAELARLDVPSPDPPS